MKSLANTKRGVLVRLLTLVGSLSCVLSPSPASAGVPYVIDWKSTYYAGSCGDPAPISEGLAFFKANGSPLATYSVPGSRWDHIDGSRGLTLQAGFDSVLLRTGTNDFTFDVSIVTGDNSCVHSREYVQLSSSVLTSPKLLFDVSREGTAFSGSTQLGLSLQEINPPLARDIANLEEAIADARKHLVENASQVADLAAKESVLQELDTELHDLVNRPLDEILQVDLDEILDRYSDVVDAATKAALEQLLADLKKSIEDLRVELTRLLSEFAAQADAAADLATKAARDAGWNPDDPSNYQLGAGSDAGVEVPDISSTGNAFNPGNDPYAAYADKVIAKLGSDVVGGQVTGRADFVANVRAWRTNTAALQKALLQRSGVSQTETNAFLNAQNRVTAYVRQFMDASDWFVDAPISPLLRALVDGPLRVQWEDLGWRVKSELNLWSPGPLSTGQQMVADSLAALVSGIEGISQVADVTADVAGAVQQYEMVISRIAVGFVPVVGDALDLCEAVTGKELCLPDGRDLTVEERMFSGAGVVIGSGAFWHGAQNAVAGPAIPVVAGITKNVETPLFRALKAAKVERWRGLRGAIKGTIEPFEFAVAQGLQTNGRKLLGIGDQGVRIVLGMAEGRAADFLSITTDGRFAITEVKGVISGKIDADDVGKALEQLRNTFDAMTAKNLGGEVAIVELAIPTGTVFEGAYQKQGTFLVNTAGGTTTVEKVRGLVVQIVELAQ